VEKVVFVVVEITELSPAQLMAGKWKLFELLGYKVHHPEVVRFHNSTAKVKVVTAARRTTTPSLPRT